MTQRIPLMLTAGAALLLALRSSIHADATFLSLPAAVGREVSFQTEVKPILERTCIECHGERKQKSDFRLDERAHAMRGGSIGVAIVPGKSAESPLIRYVAGGVDGMRMPPKGEPLTAAEIGILRAWIDQGAQWPDPVAPARYAATHWSLKPLVKPEVPNLKDATRVRTPIDAFVLATLEQKQLTPAGEADRRTLIRRVTFDLTGLPPTPEEVEAFLADPAGDAFEKVVERLLSSAGYGERWARHWMDVVHYAETHGHDEDKPRPNAWPYRDYLIRALNEDKPYARFVEEQVAGDVLYPEDPQAIVATAFLAAGPWDQSSQMGIQDGTLDKKMARVLDRDDVIATTMSTFVSATVHCARCHNHKFDPISQEDYYALQAVFAGVDRVDRPYDSDPAVAKRRREVVARKTAIELNGTASGSPDVQERVTKWENGLAEHATIWAVLEPTEFSSAQGAALTKQADGSILSSGNRPEKDTYRVVATAGSPRVTAVRLEVMSDESLPQKGPGRQENGNLHLSEFKVQVGEREVPLTRATADFDQQDWPVGKAIDGKRETAWGIFPQVGRAHVAVFELKEPLDAGPKTLMFTLDQVHGGGHLVGRFRLAVTDSHNPSLGTSVPAEIANVLRVPPPERSDPQRRALATYVLKSEIERELAALPAQQFVYAVASDFEAKGNFKPARKPRTVEVLRRGDIGQPISVATPGALSCVSGLPSRFALAHPDDEGSRRAALAKWITHRDNVLTWRSIVNRVWHYHFGRGIVETPGDLGTMGATPTHPALLDWLAVTFRDDMRGSLKQLHRTIVTSATYRQSSAHDRRNATLDAENRFLWRMNRSRLDAESVRDAVLAISGKIDLTAGGPSVKQFVESKGVHETPNVDYLAYDLDGPGAFRRSVYRFVFRTVPDPFMQTLGCPDASQLSPTRESSVTALQALTMLNNRIIVRHSEHLAERLARERSELTEQVGRLYALTFSRPPREDELELVAAYARRHGLANACRMLLNSNEFIFVN
jgi:cytochrome c553